MVKGEISVMEAPLQDGLTATELKDCKDRLLLDVENTLRARLNDKEALRAIVRP
jgi:hypothetical protein